MALDKPFIEADSLAAINSIRHGFFTRKGGISQGIYRSRNIGLGSRDERSHIAENRTRCAHDLGVASNQLATPHQIHSEIVVRVTRAWPARNAPKADALVTNQSGLLLGVATADCGPVLFADAKASVIGAAHAGWRGATGGILENTLAAMEELGAKRSRITAVLGPTIAQGSYEVGPDFVDRLLALSAANESYLIDAQKPSHALFDLPAYIVNRLFRSGVKEVCNLALDTYGNEADFFSYRRATHHAQADYGRLLSAIVLK